jgi:arginyl-tRNA synthetase
VVIDVSGNSTGAAAQQPMPPLILIKADGALLYATTDLATIAQRVEEFAPDLILYVVDSRQSDHFEQVFRAAYMAAIAPATTQMEHIGFGTMNGKDGKPFKTRAGGVMKLRDLLEMVMQSALQRMEEAKVGVDIAPAAKAEIARMVGVAALKYGDLSNHRSKNYIFDLEKFSSFDGRTGPYLLYAAVRAKSILRKAADALGPGSGTAVNGAHLAGAILPPYSDIERELMLTLVKFQDVCLLAYAQRAPNHLCEYAYNLANALNRFYQEHHILNELDVARQASWLGLVTRALVGLEQLLDLLGIEVPEQM